MLLAVRDSKSRLKSKRDKRYVPSSKPRRKSPQLQNFQREGAGIAPVRLLLRPLRRLLHLRAERGQLVGVLMLRALELGFALSKPAFLTSHTNRIAKCINNDATHSAPTHRAVAFSTCFSSEASASRAASVLARDAFTSPSSFVMTCRAAANSFSRDCSPPTTASCTQREEERRRRGKSIN